jgi:hypothetical protein
MLWMAFELINADLIAAVTNIVWVSKCFISVCFFLYWEFGTFQSLFSQQLWSGLKGNEKKKERFGTRIQRLPVYTLFTFFVSFLLLMQTRLLIYYYFPDLIPQYLKVHSIYDGYEKKTGGLALFLVTHIIYTWLFILFFYNIIMARINRRVRAFNADVRQVSASVNFLSCLKSYFV